MFKKSGLHGAGCGFEGAVGGEKAELGLQPAHPGRMADGGTVGRGEIMQGPDEDPFCVGKHRKTRRQTVGLRLRRCREA